MQKELLLCAVVFSAGCAEDTLTRICGNVGRQCYGVWNDHFQDPALNSERHAERMRELAAEGLVGVCQLGTPTCDENSNIINCEGAVYPEGPDICDGKDNNCDGEVDNGVYPSMGQYWWDSLGDNPCPSLFGVCAHSTIECLEGEFVCHLPDTYEEEETLCDNLDNDCNYLVDDIDLECTDLLGNPAPCTCYEGPQGTEREGQCEVGFYECFHGEIMCMGQTLPGPELCDQVDNDCNGIIDDTGDTLSQEYDVVFNIDTSGSMCGTINAVAVALDTYVEQFDGDSNFRFAIVIMSTSGGSGPSLVSVDTDFTDLGTVRSRLLTLGCSGSGSEGSLDSIYDICDESNPQELSWREDAIRLTFAFTDEPPQTYRSPAISGQDVINNCITSGTLPFIWHNPSYFEFTNITSTANGRSFYLVNNWQQIFDDLNSIVITLCGT